MNITHLEIENFKYSYAIEKNNNSDFPPIFFINGAFQNMHSWSYLCNLLKNQFTVIVADLPGWGSADLLPASYDFSFLAKSVDKILIKENISHINLVSTSYGSLIATHFIQDYGEKVNRLILCSPFLEINSTLNQYYPELSKIINQRKTSNLHKFLCKIGLLNCIAGQNGKIRNFNKLLPLFIRKIENLKPEDLDKFLANTDRIINDDGLSLIGIEAQKMIVVTGALDTFTTPEECSDIAERFDNVRLNLIPQADHMFLFEQPEYFADLIVEFLMKRTEAESDLRRA